jgi:hypothetical protein
MTDDLTSGPDDADDRAAELMGGALAGELTVAERAELAALIEADPALGVELEQLGATVTDLGRGVDGWREESPSEELRDRVLAATAGPAARAGIVSADSAPAGSTPGQQHRPRAPRRRSFWVPAACFAGGVLVAATGFVVAPGLQDGPPQGPPGTLGAVEDVALDGGPGSVAGARIDASLVAHTWGTETVLEIEGLPVGEGYDVVLIGADGQEYDSGSFLASAVTIDCRMNAAVMRSDVERLEIRQDDGAVVTAATLPDAVEQG